MTPLPCQIRKIGQKPGSMVSSLLMQMFLAYSLTLATISSAQDEGTLRPFELVSKKPLTLSVTHAFERSEARRRIEYLLEYWQKRFSVHNVWQGDRVYLSGRIYGMDIRAYFDVEAAQVSAKAEDPGFFMRGTTREYVEKKLKKYLSPTYEEP
jgi:Putative polyhydroxyalkanoic acid system protein (PHA_gran_rgn)